MFKNKKNLRQINNLKLLSRHIEFKEILKTSNFVLFLKKNNLTNDDISKIKLTIKKYSLQLIFIQQQDINAMQFSDNKNQNLIKNANIILYSNKDLSDVDIEKFLKESKIDLVGGIFEKQILRKSDFLKAEKLSNNTVREVPSFI